MPIPDVLVRPAVSIDGHYCDDMMVAFEVLSHSYRNRDLRWKRHDYAMLPSLQHYVVVLPNKAGMRIYDRVSGWAERRHIGIDAQLRLDAIALAVPAKTLYAGTGVI